ncbi:hypothetical protein TGRH88_002540 [Toxoplasma gondii]|uniref:Uncharacterized protein n=1 Tax=Toxoplasma gondii TaxID=5811 RepID=A0A7J6KF59_TOXGO|nr:hypothetical protein TGRH88_002540 [Toxoplasma gondii]
MERLPCMTGGNSSVLFDQEVALSPRDRMNCQTKPSLKKLAPYERLSNAAFCVATRSRKTVVFRRNITSAA